MSTDADSRAGDSAPLSFSHGLLALTFPALFIAGVFSLLADCADSIRFGDPAFALAVLAGGVASVAFNALFTRIRGGGIARHQALALALAAAYAARAGLIDGSLAERLIPSARFAACLLSYAGEWIWAGILFRFLADRERFVSDMRERGNETIFHAVREEDYLLRDAAGGVSQASKLSGLLAGFLLAALFIPLLLGTVPSLRSIALVGAFFAYREFLVALFRHFREEFALAGMGLANAFSYASARMGPAAAVIALAAIIAIAASLALPPVPSAWFFALIARLFAFLNRPTPHEELPEDFLAEPEGESDTLFPPSMPDAGEPLFDPRALFLFLKYAALVAFACAALWFLFGPFFKREFRRFFAEGAALRYLRALIGTVRAGFAAMGRAIAGAFRSRFGFRSLGRTAGDGTEARAFKASLRKRADSAKSPEKKAEIGRLTAVFATLIDWGSAAGTGWERHEAPLEYARRLAREFPPHEEDLALAGVLFEKALYAKELLGAREERDFTDAVSRILASAP